MSYPGDSSLDAKIQQRILSAFAEAVRLYQEGNPEECRTVLRSILEVDPSFAPASRLMAAVDAGAPVDLARLLGEVGAAAGLDVDATLSKARKAFAERDFSNAAQFARQILRELPGHDEARQLLQVAEARSTSAGDVSTRLRQAHEALARGAKDEAASFVDLARSLDPSHPELAALEAAIGPRSVPVAPEPPIEFEFIPAPAASTPPDGSTISRRPPAVPPPPPPAPTAHPAATVPGSRPAKAAEPPRAVPPIAPPPPARPAVAPPPVTVSSQPAVPPAAAPGRPQVPTEPADAEFEFGGSPVKPEDRDLFSVDDTPVGGVRVAPTPSQGMVPPLVPPPPVASAAPLPPPGNAGQEAATDTASRVRALLDQGQAEFDRGDFQNAIETWSRIYLIQSDCPDADRNIEEARRRREELERQADHRFYEAREAFDHGRIDEARTLCEEVLKLQPQHLEAHDLLARLETPAAPPPPPLDASGEEEDLFRDDFVPAPPAPTGMASSGASPALGLPVPARGSAQHPAAKRKFAVPTPLLLILGGLVVILIVVAVLLRSTLFGSKADMVSSTIAQADDAAQHGRLQDAINLLKSLQATEQLDGSVGNQVNQRIVNYQRTMRSQATHTPAVVREPVRVAFAAGKRVKALRLVREALAKAPGDPELTALQGEILAYSPLLATLADAVDSHDMDKVRRNAQMLRDQHPDDAEARALFDAATFNQALVMLRKYQVGAAKSLLDELARRSDDAEVDRVREFASRYSSRPVDPRYQIFVTNVELRPIE